MSDRPAVLDTPSADTSAAAPLDTALRRVALRVRGRDTLGAVAIPAAAVLVSVAVGALLMWAQGIPALSAYGSVVEGSLGTSRALTSTAVAATPLVLIGLGVALAYRAGLITIGAEGQYVIGAVVSVAVATTGAVSSLPPALAVTAAAVTAAVSGAVWSGMTAVLNSRFGASVVITSLLLNYVAAAVLAWAVRVGVRDPDAFTPQTPPIGTAALADLPGTRLHAGVVLTLALVLVMAVLAGRTRLGYRADVMGASPEVLRTNEIAPRRLALVVLAVAGAFAGLAGYVQVAGVTTTVTGSFATGLGFTAIMVALLGRLRPAGVLVAGFVMAALSVGFDSAGRAYDIPSTTSTIVQALTVLLFVLGDALMERRKRKRGRS
jgi:simple sugar transport system permease protein